MIRKATPSAFPGKAPGCSFWKGKTIRGKPSEVDGKSELKMEIN
jgi:hypothetical protein